MVLSISLKEFVFVTKELVFYLKIFFYHFAFFGRTIFCFCTDELFLG